MINVLFEFKDFKIAGKNVLLAEVEVTTHNYNTPSRKILYIKCLCMWSVLFTEVRNDKYG